MKTRVPPNQEHLDSVNDQHGPLCKARNAPLNSREHTEIGCWHLIGSTQDKQNYVCRYQLIHGPLNAFDFDFILAVTNSSRVYQPTGNSINPEAFLDGVPRSSPVFL